MQIRAIWGHFVLCLYDTAELCLHQTKFGNRIVGYVGRSNQSACKVLRNHTNTNEYRQIQVIWGCFVHLSHDNAELCLHQTKFGKGIVGYVGGSNIKVHLFQEVSLCYRQLIVFLDGILDDEDDDDDDDYDEDGDDDEDGGDDDVQEMIVHKPRGKPLSFNHPPQIPYLVIIGLTGQ